MSEVTYLPDVNVLLAAHRTTHVHHHPALAWLRAAQSFATCPTTEMGLVRLLANPTVNPGTSMTDALEALVRVRSRRQHTFWSDDTSLAAPLVSTSRMLGYKQVTDVHLVNLAARNGGVLVTFDTRVASALTPKDQRHIHVLKT